MASIFAITVVLAAATYFLFQSYTMHRKELADRWFARGQKALQGNQPLTAIDDLHSALLYAPGQRQMEVELASALASAGKIQEATAYFNTLWEAEPGNGEINVQLARLSARSGNEELAKHYYHAAIYGNWEGDGYLRRRDTRLELVRYLVSRGGYDQARSELLVAAGNAPSSDLEFQGLIGGLMVEAHAPRDALALYQQLLKRAPNDAQALEGAAHTAYGLGEYDLAHHYLLKATALAPVAAGKDGDEELLRKVSRILVLEPSRDLPPAMLAARLLGDREIARRRFQDCQQAQGAASSVPGAGGPLTAVAGAWTAEPKHLTSAALQADFQLQRKEIELIDDTEKTTAAVCGAPIGDDAILLRLAQVPSDAGPVPDHE